MTTTNSAEPRAAGLSGRPSLCALLLVASVACSTNDGGAPGSGGAAGSSTTAGSAGASGNPGTAGSSAGTTAGSGTAAGGTAGHEPAAGGSGAPSAGTGAGGAGGTGAGAGGNGTAGTAPGGSGGSETAGAGGTTGGSGGAPSDTVTRSASTYEFRHFPIQTNAEGVWSGPTTPAQQAISTTYDTVVLENGYLRVTLLPSYGGRVLSIVHKPSNRELLYQNPLGTPYLMREGIFYYDYLVILGGIFPSFPEPEHGAYWNQPYELEVVSESAEAITVRMSRQDDRDLVSGIPERYDVGRTDVRVELEVTLRAGSSALELATKLTNTRASAVPEFEYWTVTTLAPGSTPGETAIPLNTRILAQMSQVHLLESSWSWFGQAEERVSGEVFEWDKLSYFTNWVDQGTAFANPDYRANWSGLSNYDEGTSILRVSNDGETRGLKLWTFGKQSLSVDIEDSTEWLRPTIEMWHGITPEFWERGTLSANEVRSWTDHYFATFGMEEVTAASEHGALHLSTSSSGSNTVLGVTATLTLPNQAVKARLSLDGEVIAEDDVVVPAAEAATLNATVPSAEVPAGAVLKAEFLQGDRSLLSGEITLD